MSLGRGEVVESLQAWSETAQVHPEMQRRIYLFQLTGAFLLDYVSQRTQRFKASSGRNVGRVVGC